MIGLNRREFIKAGGASAAAVALGGIANPSPAAQPAAAAVPAAAPRRPYKKAIMYGMLTEGKGVMERFKILKDAGFDGVEMDGPSKIDPDEILSARDATGIAVHGIVDSVHWSSTLTHPAPEIREKGLEGLQAAIRDCHRFGGSSVLLVPGVVNKDVAYDEAWTRSQEQIRKALPLAEELKIIIAVENVWNNFLLSPMEAARYVDEFKSPYVGWHFDVGNVINFGWPEQWVRILGKRVFKLHIKEFSRQKRDKEGLWKGFDVDLLDGDCGWPAVMAALDEVGYLARSGWATAEVRGGDSARMSEIAQKMDKIFSL